MNEYNVQNSGIDGRLCVWTYVGKVKVTVATWKDDTCSFFDMPCGKGDTRPLTQQEQSDIIDALQNS